MSVSAAISKRSARDSGASTGNFLARSMSTGRQGECPIRSVLKPAKRNSRAVVIVLVGAMHVLIFGLMCHGRTEQPAADEDGPAETTLVFFDLPTEKSHRDADRSPAIALRHTRITRATTSASSPNEPPPPSQSESTAPVAVDWASEAQVAAAHQIEAEDAARRAGTALAPDRYRLETPPVAAPRFDWDYAATHRIESLPGGGLVINLSDRCAITIVYLTILGGCKIGEIEARGDLFSHMHDLPNTGSPRPP